MIGEIYFGLTIGICFGFVLGVGFVLRPKLMIGILVIGSLILVMAFMFAISLYGIGSVIPTDHVTFYVSETVGAFFGTGAGINIGDRTWT